MFSSNTDMWATPQWLFDELNHEFGFETDVCAVDGNAKCLKYFTPEMDGLSQAWEGVCWMNPPYGEPEYACKKHCKKKICEKRGYHNNKYIPGIIDWLRKAYEASKEGATVVCLVPARTDTAWWHDYAIHGEVRFLRGRLKFGDAKNSAPFPSAIVIFHPVCLEGIE
ncbi:DNA N-6-adenine-methyltransferase [Paenibacillus apiarius]|uniref:DNA N-6-adenine-methyltransferase n=1 Tax=Paenibacillus apiarius TaxID=46240 RepID=UPI003B3A6EE6